MDFLKKERAKILTWEYNRCHPQDKTTKLNILQKLLGKKGASIIIEPSFQCDYGYNIEVGENFYANHNLVILDGAKVQIGNNVMLGPNVSILTAAHPLHHKIRGQGLEFNIPIRIEDNVWIGSNVVINPGVSIGRNSVIGSGSVVTKDVEENSIYAGVPCRKIRDITQSDLLYYYKDRQFDLAMD